jgi:hypothetical protein
MTDTTAEIGRMMDAMAAELRANGEEITPEAVAQMTESVLDQIGEGVMQGEFDRHRQGVYTYLDNIQDDNTMAAVYAIKDLDPAGVIAILGSLVNFWGDLLRGLDDGPEMTLGAMAKYTFDAVDRHADCTEDNCTHDDEEA